MRHLVVIIAVMINSLAYASYDDALVLFQKKKYDESLKMIASELIVADDFKENSPNYKLRYLAAHNHWKLGNERSVIAHLKKCMEIDKTSVNPYIDLSLFLVEQKRYTDANTFAEAGLRINADPMLYWVLGRSRMAQGKLADAREFFEKAISVDPEIFIVNFDLGVVLMKMKKYGEANTAFSAASMLNTESPEVYCNLANSFYMMHLSKKSGDTKYLERAIVNIEKAKELDPKNQNILSIYTKINIKK